MLEEIKLNKYGEKWNLGGVNFNTKVIHNDKYISTKLSSFKYEIKNDFNNAGLLPKENPYLIHFIILIDSFYRSDKSFYC